jgi:hypothetical protein
VPIELILKQEAELKITSPNTFKQFSANIDANRDNLLWLLTSLKKAGKKVFGYGASTRGNTILEYCNITTDLLSAIAEINEEKFGAFTPKTHIPIISEREALAQKPDFFLVLPYHFRDFIIEKSQNYLNNGGHLIFPIPHIEII